ncbi:hypothetical protein E2C01_090822 [Portunus trituberculatus]|uniref:Uncharacterized protein n=1 Tax=Portunus trituberculatus TaxID=210409 RepID=A0A5B7JTF4_PORTR|nr:hypothetical protein [Portunus trituberculatus]
MLYFQHMSPSRLLDLCPRHWSFEPSRSRIRALTLFLVLVLVLDLVLVFIPVPVSRYYLFFHYPAFPVLLIPSFHCSSILLLLFFFIFRPLS